VLSQRCLPIADTKEGCASTPPKQPRELAHSHWWSSSVVSVIHNMETLNRTLYELKTSRRLMRKSRPQPSVGPGTHKCAYDSRNHYGDAVADERE